MLVVERRGASRVLVGKDVRKRRIGKSKLRWEGRPNINPYPANVENMVSS